MEKYQFTVQRGDFVRLPNGDLGVVAKQEILCAGHVNEVNVHPFVGATKRFFGCLFGRYRFYDREINRLQKVGSMVA